jgi:hypothetical protein
MSFLESFTFAYNTTIDSTPGIGWLYEKIPVLTDEEAFRQGLLRMKTVITMVKNLKPPRLLSFEREIVRASPVLYSLIEKNYPELHKALHPRGGKVPTTYLGKKFAQDVTAVGEKLAGQLLREAQKALPKIVRNLLGLNPEGAKLVMENVLSKSSTILAKSPEVEWAWIAGWAGLVIGSVAYATMDSLGVNQAIQSGSQWIFRYWYGVDQTELSTDKMTAVVLRRKLRIVQNATFGQAGQLGVDVPQTAIDMIRDMIRKVDEADDKVIKAGG